MLSIPRVSVRFQRLIASWFHSFQVSKACMTGTWRPTAPAKSK